jgi:cysteine desulfurase
MPPRLYLDHAATAPVRPEAWEAMRPLLTGPPGNPASAHGAGRHARRALEDARELVAARLGADPDEVIFTSGATEANNLALFGLAGDPPGHLLASPVEHPCVAEPVARLAARGFAVESLPVDRDGLIDLAALPARLRPETRLVTVMLVNHETGAVQFPASRERERPEDALVRTSASSGRSRSRLAFHFHTDAAQAVGKIPVHFHALGVTALTVSGHKFGGPPGVGALLLRRGAKLRPLLYGGHQQQGRRPGTEPVALAVGMAAALDLAGRELEANTAHVRRLRERFLGQLRADAAPVVVNSPADPARAVPHVLNVSFPGCAADGLLMALDLAGVACSTGSACSSGSLLPSPVLRAMGVPDEVLRSAMRFSFGPATTEAEVDEAAGRVVAAVQRLRSPEARG